MTSFKDFSNLSYSRVGGEGIPDCCFAFAAGRICFFTTPPVPAPSLGTAFLFFRNALIDGTSIGKRISLRSWKPP
ncbi:UNVERIFIED_ORG: hypothetical protein J2W38_003679 [Variovorax paradoxus]|nr:hypothetical protein [Variovorax paradoxus]